MASELLTIEKALSVQLRNLTEWAVVLKPEVYVQLLEYTLEHNCTLLKHNKGVVDPRDVFRGVDMTHWVREYASKHA